MAGQGLVSYALFLILAVIIGAAVIYGIADYFDLLGLWCCIPPMLIAGVYLGSEWLRTFIAKRKR